MENENTQTEQANADQSQETTTETQSKPAEQPKLYTGDEVARIVEKRLLRERDKLSKERTPTPKDKPTTQGSDAVASELAKLQADFARERDDRVFAEQLNDAGLQLTAAQRAVLRSQFDAENPAKVIELAKEIFPAPKPVNGHHVDPGAPGTQPRAERASDPMQWSVDDVQRLRASGDLRKRVEEWVQSQGGSNPFVKRRG